MSDETPFASRGELITHYSSLIITHHSNHSPLFLIQLCLQPPERGGRLFKVRLLLECQAVMLHSFQRPLTNLLHSAEIEVGKGVGLVTRRQQRSLEPAHAAVRIAFGQKITADIVVGIPQRFIDANRLEALGNSFVVTTLKAVHPT